MVRRSAERAGGIGLQLSAVPIERLHSLGESQRGAVGVEEIRGGFELLLEFFEEGRRGRQIGIGLGHLLRAGGELALGCAQTLGFG